MAALIIRIVTPAVSPFMLGAALAFALAQWNPPALPEKLAAALLVLAIWGFSSVHRDVHSLCSVAVIATLIASPKISDRMSGDFGLWLGQISFPLYLVHLLVLMSAGCFVFVTLSPISSVLATSASALTVIAVSAVAIYPFVKLEQWWVPTLNKVFKPRPHSQQASDRMLVRNEDA